MYHKHLIAAAAACLLASPSLAQTAVGVGVGTSEANSASGAIAVNRGNGNSNSSLTVNNPADTRSTVNQNLSGTTTSNINQSGTTTSNVNQNVSGQTTSRIVSSGTTTVRTAPSMVAPGLAAAGLETCLGSASGTVSAIGFGIGGGSTYADEGCQARLDSRTLYAYGLKAAAVARLCQRVDIWRSMPDMCAQYWPSGQPYPAGVVVAAPGVAVVMSTSSDAASAGVVRVIDGRDGVEKDCLNYNATKFKCLHWSGEVPKRQRTAALTPAKQTVGKPNWTKPHEKKKAEPETVGMPASEPAPVPENK